MEGRMIPSKGAYLFVASFPGPAQLSVTCSMEKRFVRGESLGTTLICLHILS